MAYVYCQLLQIPFFNSTNAKILSFTLDVTHSLFTSNWTLTNHILWAPSGWPRAALRLRISQIINFGVSSGQRLCFRSHMDIPIRASIVQTKGRIIALSKLGRKSVDYRLTRKQRFSGNYGFLFCAIYWFLLTNLWSTYLDKFNNKLTKEKFYN